MKKISRLLFGIWMTASWVFGTATPCGAAAIVTIKQDVEIANTSVRLSDLFDGVPSEIDRAIAQAPHLCKSAVYDEKVLAKLAETYRLDWQAKPDDRVVVTSPCVRITEEQVKDALAEKIKNDSGIKNYKFEISLNSRRINIELPADQKTDFEIRDFYYDASSKQFKAALFTNVRNSPYVLSLAGRVMIKRSAPILNRRLEAGTAISSSDLDWIEMPEEKLTSDIVTEEDQLIGRELRRNTAEGSLLRSNDVMPQRLVLRGSIVTMVIETPFLTVTAQGKAQQDGAKGEVVRVLNTQSNRIVEGTVTSTGVVQITTAKQLALAE